MPSKLQFEDEEGGEIWVRRLLTFNVGGGDVDVWTLLMCALLWLLLLSQSLVSPSAKHIIRRLLEHDPHQRLVGANVLKHAWLSTAAQ